MMTNRINRKSKFIGMVDLINDLKTGINHLEGQHLITPFVGYESPKIKLHFDLNLDIKKVITQCTHNQKGTKDLEILLKLEFKQFLNYGYLKVKVSKKTGNRILIGWLGNIPVIGRENRRIRNRFHLEIDEERSLHLRNYNPEDAQIAEIEFKETRPLEVQKNHELIAK